jgi:hypothetical protein
VWPWLAAAAALVLVGVGGYFVLKPPPRPGPPPPVASGDGPPATVPPSNEKPALLPALRARLDVRIWKKEDETKGLALRDEGALPLRAGDWMRVEVRTNRPAFLYLIYLDANGEGSPMYPWRKYQWDDRPPERKRTELNLPDDPQAGEGKPLEAGPSGIEAVLLLARDEPMSAEEIGQLRQVFARVPPQSKFDPLRGAVWLGTEEYYLNAVDRGRPNLDKSGTQLDPVERVRRLVRDDLKKLAADVSGVCYPFQGK